MTQEQEHICYACKKKKQPPKHLWRELHVEPLEGRIIMFPFYGFGIVLNLMNLMI